MNDTNLQLLRNGTAVPISSRVDGAAVVIVPATPLEHNVPYTVVFSSAMTDIAGNGVSDATNQRTFSLPALTTPGSHSPSVVTTSVSRARIGPMRTGTASSSFVVQGTAR